MITASLLALTLAVIASVGGNALRGPVEYFAGRALGRAVSIEGDLRVDLLRAAPRLRAAGVQVAEPRWMGSGQRAMAHIGHIEVQIELLSLLRGDLVLPRLIIGNSSLQLARLESGAANWLPRARGKVSSGRAGRLPLVHHFELDDTEISLDDAQRKLHFRGTARARETGPEARSFMLEASGRLNGEPIEMHLRGAPLINLRRDRPYAFELQVRAPRVQLDGQGALARPFDLNQLTAQVRIRGADLANLYYLTGLTLPNTAPYTVKGHVRRAGSLVELREFDGTFGDSDLHANLDVQLQGPRPLLTGEVTSRAVTIGDLVESLGATESLRAAAAAAPENVRLLPDAQLQVQRLRGMDAKVHYRAASVRTRRVPLRAVDLWVRLDAGVLVVGPGSITLPQGTVSGSVRIDGTAKVPRTHLDLRVDNVALDQFRRRGANEAPLTGVLRGRAQLQGEGDSLRKVAASSDGTVTLVLPQGEIREAFAELTGINVARGLGLLLSGDQKRTEVRCGIADFRAVDGRLVARNLVFDTENVFIEGQGDISLESERVDLSLKGEPKKLRLLRLRAPIEVTGPIRKPNVGVKSSRIAAQTGIAAAVAVVAAPLAAVLAFIDPGLGKDANCSALIARAQKRGVPLRAAEKVDPAHAAEPIRR